MHAYMSRLVLLVLKMNDTYECVTSKLQNWVFYAGEQNKEKQNYYYLPLLLDRMHYIHSFHISHTHLRSNDVFHHVPLHTKASIWLSQLDQIKIE